MASAAAARRYARALYQLARDEGRVDEVRAELSRFAALLDESRELHGVLFRPLHPMRERRAVLVRVAERLGASTLISRFFTYLIDRRRIVDFPQIRAEFERLADESAGLLRAEVTAAAPLEPAQRERLTRALSERTGRRVELAERIDPALIGGLIAKVGDLVYDGSLRTQLRQLRTNLMRGH
jgi:F-type H+-transporting ATPase subunit delta